MMTRKKRPTREQIILMCVIWALAISSSALAQDSVKVMPLNPVIKAKTLYKLEWATRDTVRSNSAFEVEFPAGFDLRLVEIAGSTKMTGGFSVDVTGKRVTVLRKDRGNLIPPGQRIDLLFSLITNPKTPSLQYPILLRVMTPNDSVPQGEYAGKAAIVAKLPERL